MSNSDHPFMKATISISSVVICLFLASCEKHPESPPNWCDDKRDSKPRPGWKRDGNDDSQLDNRRRQRGPSLRLENGQAEKLSLDKIPQGSGDAPWIQAGRSYEFRLYDAAHAKLLGKVVVTRAEH